MKTFRAIVEWNAWDFTSAYEDLQRDQYQIISLGEVAEHDKEDDS